MQWDEVHVLVLCVSRQSIRRWNLGSSEINRYMGTYPPLPRMLQHSLHQHFTISNTNAQHV